MFHGGMVAEPKEVGIATHAQDFILAAVRRSRQGAVLPAQIETGPRIRPPQTSPERGPAVQTYAGI